VTRGQTLATLDTASLDDAVDTAQAALDQAKLALANALTANAESSSAQAQDTTALDQARQAVLDGQRLVDERLSAAQAALESANAVCAAVTEESVTACQSALNDVLRAQSETNEAQSALSAASNALEELRNQSSSSQPTRGDTGGTASAADLKRYQKEIDAAAAAVAVAKQNVAAATIVSPIDGTIEDVDLRVGDTVSAGSSASAIRVAGPSGYEVTAIVSVDDLKDVKLGQAAVVTPDGTNKEVRGEVVAIGAPRTSNGATTYPVSVGVDDDSALRNGTVANVSITTGEGSSGIAVPTSAVHVEGTRKTVTVLRDGDPKVVTVTVGVIGRQWTQIKSGIKAGDRVVLADLNEPLPGDVTSSSNGNNGKDQVFRGDGGPIVEFAPPNGGGGNGGPAGFKIGP
jgi:HlyD family secretion protein